MFTGIIEDVGIVESITTTGLKVRTALGDISNGKSIAVNGICLTVTKTAPSAKGTVLSFDFTPETFTRTNIGELKKGIGVNLERALRASDRFDGHIVTGHVEGIAKVLSIKTEGNSVIFAFGTSHGLDKYIVEKGSIAVDGISLTVVDCQASAFTVSIVPHTIDNTNLRERKVGEKVNIETDILAKYAEKLLTHNSAKADLTEGFLKEHGFIN